MPSTYLQHGARLTASDKTKAVAKLWLRVTLGVFFVWLALELWEIWLAYDAGEPLDIWTYSDTIRRWSEAHCWLAPVAIGVNVGLLWHFFGQKNTDDSSSDDRSDTDSDRSNGARS